MEGQDDFNSEEWQTADLLREVDEIFSFSGRRESKFLIHLGKVPS